MVKKRNIQRQESKKNSGKAPLKKEEAEDKGGKVFDVEVVAMSSFTRVFLHFVLNNKWIAFFSIEDDKQVGETTSSRFCNLGPTKSMREGNLRGSSSQVQLRRRVSYRRKTYAAYIQTDLPICSSNLVSFSMSIGSDMCYWSYTSISGPLPPKKPGIAEEKKKKINGNAVRTGYKRNFSH